MKTSPIEIPEQGHVPTVQRRLLTLAEFCRDYRLSRASAYRLMKSGQLKSVRILGRRLIPVEAAEALLEAA